MADPAGTIRLVELICARLCHDLGGLIGTVDNALEMVTGDAGRDNEVLAFASSASKSLARRLRLMRAALGPETETLSLTALRALTVPPMAARRISIDTTALAPERHFSPEAGRVTLNLILLAADSLPKGGIITLMGDPSDVFLRIEGPGAAWPPGLTACLQDEASAMAALTHAQGVQMPLTVLLALSRRLRISPVFGPVPGVIGLRLTGA